MEFENEMFSGDPEVYTVPILGCMHLSLWLISLKLKGNSLIIFK